MRSLLPRPDALLPRLLLLGPLAALLAVCLLWPARESAGAAWRGKVAPSLLAQATDEAVPFIIELHAQADLSLARQLADRQRRLQFVVSRLRRVASQSQQPVTARLDDLRAPYRAYWVTNVIWARGDVAVVQAVAELGEVAAVHPNSSLQGVPSAPLPAEPTTAAGIEPSLALIDAPAAWAAGYAGQGVVIGGQDTGYDWDHPALIANYRGWDGATADHNFNWHDAIHENNPATASGNPCGFDSPEPCDDNSHGTHTMGTMAGDDGADNQIGVAPGARWIACRNMEEGWGTVQTYTECFQWFLAPTDLSNANPDPARAPHIINNSWSCPASEGCTDVTVLQAIAENVRAAGILVVASAGNTGPGCASVVTPPAIYDASTTVGATTLNDTMASFSSRGPVAVDGSNRLKPDLVAPGVSIRSSVPAAIYGYEYGYKSGTSMAAPHVAGVAAIVLSARPELAGHVEELEAILLASSLPIFSSEVCGDVPGSQVPNNTAGHGRVDAWSAVQAALAWGGALDHFVYQPLLLHP